MEPTQTTGPSVVTQAFLQAPEEVRFFIESGSYEAFMRRTQEQMGLHMDVANIVSEEILMMLLGMSEPQELTGHLQQEAQLSSAQVSEVIARANAEIFVPLREAMQAIQKPDPRARTPEPLVAAPQIGPRPTPQTPAAPVNTPPPAPPQPKPQPPAPAAPQVVQAPEPPRPIPPSPPAPVYTPPPEPVAPAGMMRTMAHDVESYAKDGQVPAPIPYTFGKPKAPEPLSTPVPTPTPAPNPPKPQVPQSPQRVSPPMPEVRKEAVSSSYREPVRASTPPPTGHTLKEYGVDPYREPVE